jgi:hypothetical protein
LINPSIWGNIHVYKLEFCPCCQGKNIFWFVFLGESHPSVNGELEGCQPPGKSKQSQKFKYFSRFHIHYQSINLQRRGNIQVRYTVTIIRDSKKSSVLSLPHFPTNIHKNPPGKYVRIGCPRNEKNKFSVRICFVKQNKKCFRTVSVFRTYFETTETNRTVT